MSKVKLITSVPKIHADAVREAICSAGAGIYGNYSHCTFSVEGVGTFLPKEGANPSIGVIGKLESVIEEKIEASFDKELLPKVVKALRSAHPYEEPIIDVYNLVDFDY